VQNEHRVRVVHLPVEGLLRDAARGLKAGNAVLDSAPGVEVGYFVRNDGNGHGLLLICLNSPKKSGCRAIKPAARIDAGARKSGVRSSCLEFVDFVIARFRRLNSEFRGDGPELVLVERIGLFPGLPNIHDPGLNVIARHPVEQPSRSARPAWRQPQALNDFVVILE
jgi:hypothetical protein